MCSSVFGKMVLAMCSRISNTETKVISRVKMFYEYDQCSDNMQAVLGKLNFHQGQDSILKIPRFET